MKLPEPPRAPDWLMRQFPLNGRPPTMPRKWGNWIDAALAVVVLVAWTAVVMVGRDTAALAAVAGGIGMTAAASLVIRAVADLVRQEQVLRWLDSAPREGDVPSPERFT